MATWVDVHGAPAYFRGGFAADMGPYIGPWPLLPPGEMTGLSDSAEIDFFVALPNPADTADVTVVADDTYDTPIWDAYRYFTTAPDTNFDYYGDVTGGTVSVPTDPPAGVHLYVIVYDGSTAPTNPPEFYVPASYAAGGSAAFETEMGHWSDYQLGYDESGNALHVGSEGGWFGNSDNTYTGNRDISALAADAAAEAAASTPAVGGADPIVYAIKHHDDNVTRLRVSGNVQTWAYSGTSVLNADNPPALTPLEWDVDYSDTPYIDADGNSGREYEYSAPPTWDWDAAGDEDGAEQDWIIGAAVPNDGSGLKVRIQWLPGTTLAGMPLTVAGNLIEDRTLVATNGAVASRVNYAGITEIEFILIWGQAFLYGDIALPDFPFPDSFWVDYSVILGFAPSTPKLNVHRSTWRYWIPGDIVPSTSTPKWHTVAGSWVSISGAPMAIFTPGLGPVEYADGPA